MRRLSETVGWELPSGAASSRDQLRTLPPPFDRHSIAADQLANRFPARPGGVREWLDAWFGRADPKLVRALMGLDQLHRHKLLSTLSALAHA